MIQYNVMLGVTEDGRLFQFLLFDRFFTFYFLGNKKLYIWGLVTIIIRRNY